MTSSATPFASAEPPHWQPVSFTVLALGAVCLGLKAAHDSIGERSVLDDAHVHCAAALRGALLAQHVDAAALEHAASIAGGVCACVLVGVRQGRAHLAACHASKPVCGNAGALHQDNGTVCIIHQSHAEGQGLFFAHRASDNDHVGLACVGTGKAVIHLRADDLRVELRKCHTIKPPYACAG